MTPEVVLFYALAGLALLGALAMLLFVKEVVASVMGLAITMISLAGIYLLLEAHLVAVLQIIVYAGSILVLFLLAIMLSDPNDDGAGRKKVPRVAVKAASVAAALLLGGAIAGVIAAGLPAGGELPAGFGGYRDVGLQLFTAYVIPVEAAGLLLLAAVVSAVVLAKQRVD